MRIFKINEAGNSDMRGIINFSDSKKLDFIWCETFRPYIIQYCKHKHVFII